MKRSSPHSSLARRSSRPSTGFALVTVLLAILLLTALVVAFLLRAGVARNSSANFRASSATRVLADTAVNLVQAEINEATTSGRTDTWASQPGAIRTFDNAGNLKMIYRLYSSTSLTATSYSQLAGDLPPTTWASSPAQWVDLNAPITVTGATDPNGNPLMIYPILDPRDPASASSPAAVMSSTKLPGFSVGTPPGATAYQPAPMPVQWLYELQNGQIIAPSSSVGTTVSFTGANVPSKANPIVGRIAFWTDDETCKVNINTAGGSVSYRTDNKGVTTTTPVPAPWDTPRFGSSWDDVKLFAEDQPVASEYQRYPGHPASTILYNIFNALGVNMPEIGTQTAAGSKVGNTSGTDSQSGGTAPTGKTSSLYGLFPRYSDDYGSQGGVANTTASNSPLKPTPNRSRLYTSLGELLYSTSATAAAPPVRVVNGTLLSGARPPVAPFLTRQQVETGKFFLTAHSRAPEVTLFGTPRVTIWPEPDTTNTSVSPAGHPTRTAIDKLIAFCSTTDTGKAQAGNKYYFQRYDRTSPTNDWANEPRNQSLFSYLQALTSAEIPGYGGNFLAKYGASNISSIASERDQILTEMVDYIRCTNLNDHGNPGGVNFSTTGEVVPLKITAAGNSSSGLGRVATLSEVGLHIICTADGTNNLAAINAINPNAGYSGAGNSGTSVAYNTPVITAVSATIPVSPVIGSASDPAYVSNLPASQFLRDTTNKIVDTYGVTVTSGNASTCTPFPANQTLTSTGQYGGALSSLPIGSKRLQAMLLFELASPMNGYDIMSLQGGWGPGTNIHVTNIQNIPIAGQHPFPNRTDPSGSIGPNVNGNGYLNGTIAGTTAYGWVNNGDQDEGGIFGFRFPLTYYSITATNTGKSLRCNGWSGKGALTPLTGSNTDTMGNGGSIPAWTPFIGPTLPYRFISNPFTVSTSSLSLGGVGASDCFNVSLEIPVSSTGVTSHVPYQTFTVGFPSITLASTPTLCAYGFKYSASAATSITHAPDWWNFDNRVGWCNTGSYVDTASPTYNSTANLGLGCVIRGDSSPPAGGWGTAANPWSYLNTVGTTAAPNTAVGLSTGATSYGDVVRSVLPIDGDYRVTMARPSGSNNSITVNAVPTRGTPDFVTPPQYSTTSVLNTHLMMEPKFAQGTSGVDISGSLISLGGYTIAPMLRPKIPSTLSGGTPNPQKTWDWDSGNLTGGADGAFANKSDEGDVYTSGGSIPYGNANLSGTISSYFTANRMLTSAVAFGSLPTGVAEDIPWRTLLFRPQANRATLTGLAATPKDELLLDLFTMPVVQPYAISEPFSTAGKVNMNYQILPFTYLLRDTAVRAVLGSELVARIPLSHVAHAPFNSAAYYKGGGNPLTQGSPQTSFQSTQNQPSGFPFEARLPLNLDETTGTLRQFQDKFASGDIFRSAAEICDIYLVPNDAANPSLYTDWMTGGAPYTAADTSWYGSDFALVGDNVREHPYGNLYARLTTKSNTFTVHYKVQVLKNPTRVDQTKWDESTGVVTGEYRGSTTLERYLDPNNNNIPDYGSISDPTNTGAASLDTYYQWRIVANDLFSP